MTTQSNPSPAEKVFTEIPLPKKRSLSEKPAVMIHTVKGRIYIHNHADPELVKEILANL